MTDRPNPQIASRKRPRQARSNELVSAILEAAVQVLANEGAQRFTTTRVAERAGVSVGSVYQYFPNKAAILFQLQSDEWRQTTDMLRTTLEDTRTPPFERLRKLVHNFICSECDEAQVRTALNDAAPLYRHAPEARAAKASGEGCIQSFMQEILPNSPDVTRKLAGELITTTLSTVGKDFSETPRSLTEINIYADAMADMFCAYLANLQQKSP